MARPFALAGLLRVRKIAQDRAAAELAEQHRLEDAARERAAQTARMLGATVPTDITDIDSWHAITAARLSLSALLVEARGQVDLAAAQTAAATAGWTAARQATRSVERLGERHAALVRQEEDRAEQQVLDEVASRRGPQVQP